MSSNIILTQAHYTTEGEFIYPLKQTKLDDSHKIALTSFTLNNSFFNIAKKYNNNVITYTHFANYAGIPTRQTYNFTLKDGFYSTPEFQAILQYHLAINNLYAYNSVGDMVYFVGIKVNSPIYGNTLSTIPIETQGGTLPLNANWTFPLIPEAPTISFNGSGELFGYLENTYYGGGLAISRINSVIVPQINKVTTVIIACNFIENVYSNPNDILFSIPVTSAWGQPLNSVLNLVYSKIAQNTYNKLKIQLYDQDFNRLDLNDKQSVIQLSII